MKMPGFLGLLPVVLLGAAVGVPGDMPSGQGPVSAKLAKPDAVVQTAHAPILREGMKVDKAKLGARYAKLPLSFEANQGQTDGQVKFVSRGRGYSLLLTATEVAISLQRRAPDSALRGGASKARATSVLRMKLAGANPEAQVAGLEQLRGRSNYFLGNDPKKWRRNVPLYAKVKSTGVYPGVDLLFYGNQQQLEYDFVVGPGADPGIIRLQVDGAKNVKLDSAGDVRIRTDGGEMRLHKPHIFQESNGQKRDIEGRYTVARKSQIGFQIGPYDRGRALVIDPVLSYSVVFGGHGDADPIFTEPNLPFGIAVDSSGSAYVSGATCARDFPATFGTFQSSDAGTDSCDDAFVLKLDPTGSTLVFSTYLGGSNRDGATRIALDNDGGIYLTGVTQSDDFPTTPGAFQTGIGGGTCTFGMLSPVPCSDAFVTKLSADGSSLVYSTFLGGTGMDGGVGIAVDSSGAAYVTGFTASADFPTTPNTIQNNSGGRFDAFVSKLSPDGSALLYSTYLGGNDDDFGMGIVPDVAGNAYVAGGACSRDFPTTPGSFQPMHAGSGDQLDAWVAKINTDGSALLYSTFLGGAQRDFATAVAIDANGAAYVTGTTASADFPTTPGSFQPTFGGSGFNCGILTLECGDAFVTKLAPDGSALVYSSYLGGTANEGALSIALDASNNVWITGSTQSANFPLTADAYYTGGGQFADRIFLSELDATGAQLLFSTFLSPGGAGPMGTGVVLDSAGNVYATGQTDDFQAFPTFESFPTTPGAYTAASISLPAGYVVQFVPGSDQPQAQVSPTELQFPDPFSGQPPFPVGSTSPPQTVTLTNGGTAPLNLAVGFEKPGSEILQSFPAGFSETDSCGSSLAAGASCAINVVFHPTAEADLFTYMVIRDNAPGGPHAVSLRGSVGIPELPITPSAVTLGGQAVGTSSASQRVQVGRPLGTGMATMPFSVSSMTVDGPAAGDFILNNGCGIGFVQDTCPVFLTFKPTATGLRQASVTITDSAPGSPHTVSLTGTGTDGPAVILDQSSLDFGNLVLGTSAARAVNLTNSGATTLNIASVAAGDDFMATSMCGATVPPGAQCTINVTFTPSATGTRAGTLTITDDAFDSPQSVPLAGVGIDTFGPALKITVENGGDFGSVPVGLNSALLRARVKNEGNTTLHVATITTTGEFVQTSQFCNFIPPGTDTCSLQLTFTPAAAGVRTGSLSIVSNAPGSPNVLALTGVGADSAVASVDPKAVAFGRQAVGTTNTLGVTLTNSGSAVLNISAVFISGSADFSATNNCGGSVAPGTSCTISVAYTPSNTGASAATLSIADNAIGGMQSAGLTGIGIDAGTSAALVPGSLDFGQVPPGSTSAPQTTTLYNTGTTALAIGGVLARGNFAQTNTCGPRLDPGASCAVNVTFTPPVGGPFRGSVVVTSNAIGSPQLVALTGSGILNKAATSISLTSSMNPSVLGQAVTFTANVTSDAGTPTGSVTFLDGGRGLAAGKLNAGQATFTTNSLTAGNHAIHVTYGGDANFDASVSPVLVQVVSTDAQPAASALVVSPPRPAGGQPVRFAAAATSLGPGARTERSSGSNHSTLDAAVISGGVSPPQRSLPSMRRLAPLVSLLLSVVGWSAGAKVINLPRGRGLI